MEGIDATKGPISHQRFPIYYEGVGEFKDADGDPSGAVGAVADVPISINNRPHELVGVRVVNVYEQLPLFETIEIIVQTDPLVIERKVQGVAGLGLPLEDLCCHLQRLDGDQSLRVELAQQNVVVRDLHQRTMTGRDGVHWHPFACSYPFRGGNNVVCRLVRLTSYPEIITPTVHVTLVGWIWVSDEGVEPQPPAPPSTGFPLTVTRRG